MNPLASRKNIVRIALLAPSLLALLVLASACKADLKGTWKGTCTVTSNDKTTEHDCSIAVNDKEMDVSIHGWVRCVGPYYAGKDAYTQGLAQCALIDKDGKEAKLAKPCAKILTTQGGFSLRENGGAAKLAMTHLETDDRSECAPAIKDGATSFHSFEVEASKMTK